MAQKQRLGRGLGALIGDSPVTEEAIRTEPAVTSVSRETLEMPIIQIDNNPDQPRRKFDEEALNELASSLRLYGMIQPIVVRPGANGRYTIISGERRWRAAKIAKMSTVPVLIREVEDQTLLELALVENIQRENLNAIETAASMQVLMQEYGLTQIQLAERLGKSRTAITNTMRLLKLAPSVQQLVRDGRLSEGQARPLVSLDFEKQVELAQIIMNKNLNARQAEELANAAKTTDKVREKKVPLTNPDLVLVENLFRDTLGCKVQAKGTSARGTITLQYFTKDDLGRIYDILTTLQQ